MASFLLDTHCILWHLGESPRLSSQVHELLSNPEHSFFVSIMSYWEMGIKASLGKLELPVDIETLIQETEEEEIFTLAIKAQHLGIMSKLPFHHKDPFYRLLIATAKSMDIPILSSDEKLQQYELEVIW